MRAPVDFNLAAVQPVTLIGGAHRASRHAAAYSRTPIPLQFIASTCIAQERLNCSRLRVGAHAKAPAAGVVSVLFLASRRFYGAIPSDIRALRAAFLASERVEPARTFLVQSMPTAIRRGTRNVVCAARPR
jgi:hypothetical protein